jgi:hypothetical protein
MGISEHGFLYTENAVLDIHGDPEEYFMNTPAQAMPENKLPANIVVMLLVTFLSGLLNFFGLLMAVNAIGESITIFGAGGCSIKTTWFSILALFFIPISFLAFGLYSGNRKRNLSAGFWALVAFFITAVASASLAPHLSTNLAYNLEGITFVAVQTGNGIAFVTFLLKSGKAKNRTDYTGVGLGLIIGIGLCITGYFIDPVHNVSIIGSSSIWLSAAFFPELLSHRANQRDSLLWIALILLSLLLMVGLGRVFG